MPTGWFTLSYTVTILIFLLGLHYRKRTMVGQNEWLGLPFHTWYGKCPIFLLCFRPLGFTCHSTQNTFFPAGWVGWTPIHSADCPPNLLRALHTTHGSVCSVNGPLVHGHSANIHILKKSASRSHVDTNDGQNVTEKSKSNHFNKPTVFWQQAIWFLVITSAIIQRFQKSCHRHIPKETIYVSVISNSP